MPTPTTFQSLVGILLVIIEDALIPLVLSAGVVVFMFGIVKYIAGGDDEQKRSSGRQFMIWGIVGFFVILGVQQLVGILVATFGLGGAGIPQF
jgi:hypothetical protein